jgi:DNA-directed RNA polymerase specialized sigma24 family protein
MTIARCRVSNWYRDHRREREELTGKAEDIATALRTAELPEELISNKGLAAVVRELPQRQREAVFLRFLVGLGTDSIALHMGIGGSWVATSDLQVVRMEVGESIDDCVAVSASVHDSSAA